MMGLKTTNFYCEGVKVKPKSYGGDGGVFERFTRQGRSNEMIPSSSVMESL